MNDLHLKFKIQNSKFKTLRGQALPIVALSMIVLAAIVGLAVDGGSMYSERRRAQNSADGAAMAGTRLMLSEYQDMMRYNPQDVDGTANEEDAIWAAIKTYAARNGVDFNKGGKLSAYFVNDSKQVVTAASGENGCGTSAPCQVGYNGRVPWVRGAKGILVTAYTETDAFLMAVIGWNRIGASANATAYMGVSTETNDGFGMLPIGFFTDTTHYETLVVGREYTIINGSTRRGSGNWGYVDFNLAGNPAPVVNAWIACGFHPSMLTAAEWRQWCTDSTHQNETRAVGPVTYWTGEAEPLSGPYTSRRIEWDQGWWIAGSSGTTNSTCQVFEDMQDEIRGKEYLIPVFDRNNGQGGNNTKFHMIALAWFRITDTDIYCHPRQGEDAHWAINGTFIQRYNAGSSGRHGDIRRTSNPVVFLEP